MYAYGSGNAFPSSSFNAANYWVDVVFSQSAGSTPPSVTSVTPAAGATGVAVSAAPSATFSQAVVPNTVSFTVKDSGGNSVRRDGGLQRREHGGDVHADQFAGGEHGLHSDGVGGAEHLRDADEFPVHLELHDGAVAQCPCSIWQNGTPTGAVDANDTSPVNLGLQFQASSSGRITGIRFYKETDNTGTHTGTLWSATGTLLATGTFTSESASGWQELDFSTPVTITAGTTYVASYHTDTGHYAATTSGLSSAVTNGPLTALASGGVYAYGSGNVFPTQHLQRRQLLDRCGVFTLTGGPC